MNAILFVMNEGYRVDRSLLHWIATIAIHFIVNKSHELYFNSFEMLVYEVILCN